VNFIDTAKAFFMNNTMFSVGEYFLVTGIIVWLIALVFSALFTRAAISLCWRYRALDEPDGQLKRHENSTPVLGGIPLFFASVLAVAVIACFTDLTGFAAQAAISSGGPSLSPLSLPWPSASATIFEAWRQKPNCSFK